MQNVSTATSASYPFARYALWLLLGINLFNYIDRQVLSAVLPKLKLDATLFAPNDPFLNTKLGLLTTAFLVSYMLLSPVFGWLSESRSRWLLVGIGVIAWSLASGASGLATSFLVLLLTRCCVGVGEAAYGPVAPSMLSDLYPQRERGRILSYFYLAIPVGSALGFVIGGLVAGIWGWRAAFLVVVLPGLILGVVCFWMQEPARTGTQEVGKHGLRDYARVFRRIWRVPSFRYNTIAMTASTFILGGVAAVAPLYVFEREGRFQISDETLKRFENLQRSDGSPFVPDAIVDKLRPLIDTRVFKAGELREKLSTVLTRDEIESFNATIFDTLAAPGSMSSERISIIFGAIVVVSGLFATLLGGMLGDKLRDRFPGSYFLVAGAGCLAAFPCFLAMLFVPFPWAWLFMFAAVFGLFFNTGPANAILANVVPSHIRATAFAINILIIHTLGDAISPPIIGRIADFTNLHDAFFITSFFILIAGVIWTMGARHLDRDTKAASAEEMHPGPIVLD
jgi:MFS transporter, Spinster family, sphingosine-1-phosphate transporter